MRREATARIAKIRADSDHFVRALQAFERNMGQYAFDVMTGVFREDAVGSLLARKALADEGRTLLESLHESFRVPCRRKRPRVQRLGPGYEECKGPE